MIPMAQQIKAITSYRASMLAESQLEQMRKSERTEARKVAAPRVAHCRQKVVMSITGHPGSSLGQIVQLVGCPTQTVQNSINKLISDGLVRSLGIRGNRTYFITSKGN